MKILRLGVAIAAFFLIASQIYAGPPKDIRNKGAMGRGVNKGAPADRIADEAAEAVTDVLTGENAGDMPPGLAKKGTMPPGLAKQGKTPPGWDKGKKVGWGKDQAESPIKNFTNWLFGQK